MKINRESLLGQLEAVQPGLAPAAKETVDQSSCFVFKDKRVLTYNDEIACSIAADLELEGAVKAAPLLALLRKMTEDDVEIEATDGELLVGGRKRKAGITLEKEILLPLDAVDLPEKWRKLPEDFLDAVSIVQQCAGRDESQFSLTCLNIAPEWIEACDNFQLTRYDIATGAKASVLIRQSSIKHVVGLGVTRMSETESWVHFKNRTGLVISCRRYVEDYPDLAAFLAVKGKKTKLPKGLAEATEKAEIFSSENVENNQVSVTLKSGKLHLRGQGVSGWYSETKNINYDGEPLSFMIAPKLLAEITKRHNECEITQDRLKVDGGNFSYVTVLGKVEEKE